MCVFMPFTPHSAHYCFLATCRTIGPPKDLRVLRSQGMVVGDENLRLLEKLVEQIQQREVRGWQTLRNFA